MRLIGFGLFASIGVALFSASIAIRVAEAETRFTIIDSSPTSWVARGYDNYTVSPAVGWTFTPSRNFDNGVSFRIEGPPRPGTSVDYWRLDFAAPFNRLITPGLYSNFRRYPFQDANQPGLSFSSTGRLDNMASGTYQVLQVSYGTSGTVTSFSADFTHYGETNPANYAMVELRYNAIIPEPSSYLPLLIASFALLATYRGERDALDRD